MGADVVIDTREISVADYAKQSGTLFAAVLECSAAPGAFNEALAVTEPGGTVVEVALTPESASVPLFPLISEGHHVVGSCAFSDETYRGVRRAPRVRAGPGGAAGLRAGVARRHARRAAAAADAGLARPDHLPSLAVTVRYL